MSRRELWERYQRYLCLCPRTGIRLDVSRMGFEDRFIDDMSALLARAFGEMDALESGAVANPDEGRMVGHYWLRSPERAPHPSISAAITDAKSRVAEFARRVHAAAVRPQTADRFTMLLVIGIGGSALGP